MTMEDVLDIRWKQRFENFKRAYTRLSDAILTIESLHDTDSATLELMEEGLIQRFEYTHELAWNVLKDYLHYEGYNDINGSRSAIRKALAIGLIEDRRWMDSINDRNLTSHSYDEETTTNIQQNIINIYYPLFTQLLKKMEKMTKQ